MADEPKDQDEPARRDPEAPELRRDKRRSRALADAEVAFWEWDPTTGRGTTSPYIYELLGVPRDVPFDSHEAVMPYVHPEDRERLAAAMYAYVASDSAEPLVIEYRMVRLDGEIRWIRSIGRVLQDEPSAPGILVGTSSNITEAKLLQEELAEARRLEAIGRLAGGVAHDFNNLLTAIFASVHFAGRATGDALARELDTIRTAAERASKLTQQLLAFARKQVIHLQPIVLNEVIVDLEDMLRRLLGEDVALACRLAPDLWTICGDPTQLEQVLVNLLTNAREAMPDGGSVRIETRNVVVQPGATPALRPGAYACLVVRDTGPGLEPEARDHLFEPFFTTKPRGTGLGLASTYGIVKQLGGHVAVDTERGRGTTFSVYLPRTTDPATEAPEAVAVAAPTRVTILVVEDDDLVRRGLVRGLVDHGYEVLVARDGEEALATVRDHRGSIALAVVDVIMPRMSGRALADRLAAVRPDTAILFASGHTDEVIARHGVLEPGQELIEKPYTIAQLARRIEDVLGRRRDR